MLPRFLRIGQGRNGSCFGLERVNVTSPLTIDALRLCGPRRFNLRRLSVLLCAFLLSLSHAAWGDDLPVLPLDPEREATSDCIGKPITPLCAIETLESCISRGLRSHCEIVGFDPSAYEIRGKLRSPGDYGRLRILRYRLLSVRALTAGDIPGWAREQGAKSWRPGDTAMLVEWQSCKPVDSCVVDSRGDPARRYGEGCPPTECSWDDHSRTYVVRHRNGRWAVVDEHWDPVLHRDFWKRK